MKKIILSFGFLTLTSLSYGAPIIGGEVVTEGSAPGVFNIFTTEGSADKDSTCTASKIGAKYILTAAHCVYGKNPAAIGWSNASTVDLSDEKTELYGLHVKKMHIHPSYELLGMNGESYKSNDIAIIEIDTTKGNYLKKFQDLPEVQMDFNPVIPGQKLKAYGYGCEETGDLENPVSRKKSADLVVQNFNSLYATCPELHPLIKQNAYPIYQAQFSTAAIAGGGDASVCEGDSGGPVLRDGKIVGVNSKYIIDQTSSTQDAYINLHSRMSQVKSWVEGIVK